MNTHPERAAIEQLIPQLRPFVLEGDERFVLPDGTELRVAGISRANFHAGDRCGAVAVLCRAGDFQREPPRSSVNCSGAVMLRSESDQERRLRQLPDGFAATCVVEGVATEARDDQGRRTIFPFGGQAAFPLLITGHR